jgi:hypothetical protein
MSPKKTILRTLSELQTKEGGPYALHPPTIPGFVSDPGKFQESINDLLKDRLIEGTKDGEGKMAISLNPHRAKDVQRILRPLWAHPVLLAAAALTAAAAAGFGFLF